MFPIDLNYITWQKQTMGMEVECRLHEYIPLFLILYLKLYIMVWEMASASF